MEYIIKQANEKNKKNVSDILTEAALWMMEIGKPIWEPERFLLENFDKEFNINEFFICYEDDNNPVAVMSLHTYDPKYWPDVPPMDSVFVHKLAVKRAYSGIGISQKMLSFAVEYAKKMNIKRLRLDVHADREKVRKIYEKFGFNLFLETVILEKYHVAYYIMDLE